MNISNLFYSIKQGFKNIYTNRLFSLASIGTISACLFLFGIFYFVLANFQHMIKVAESSVGITVFFEEGTDDDTIKQMGEDIKNARPEVSQVEFISADQAWAEYKETVFKQKPELVDSFGEDNPLEDSASLGIYLSDISKQKDLVSYIEGLSGVRQVNSSDTTAEGLTSFNSLVGYVSIAIIVILVAVAVFLISTTVSMGISVRRDEIAVMKLVGATDFFIRAPFIVEGMLIGLMGAALPLILLRYLYKTIIVYISEKFMLLAGILDFLDAGVIFKTLIPVSLAIGVGIGFLGSIWTVRKHLKV
ncbi:permease-like cell division protein FtsX [Anaerolentibacter hominis]|uniref:permease-like cell division protein FtsX n=1 Tax=Anaerolentibacter hominis TaxID=3079009 RepID=UPI0031B8972E